MIAWGLEHAIAQIPLEDQKEIRLNMETVVKKKDRTIFCGYCLGKTTRRSAKVCPDCGIQLCNSICAQHHKCYVNRYGWQIVNTKFSKSKKVFPAEGQLHLFKDSEHNDIPNPKSKDTPVTGCDSV